ncbi:hypothetical protein [Streptomyces sp. NPDC051636]|uniref:hypothetical protein n=1 Tax=Streptomyces sp. NPDC051636 TaxID=3365663 RepID=UPI003787CD4E
MNSFSGVAVSAVSCLQQSMDGGVPRPGPVGEPVSSKPGASPAGQGETDCSQGRTQPFRALALPAGQARYLLQNRRAVPDDPARCLLFPDREYSVVAHGSGNGSAPADLPLSNPIS